MSNAERPRRPRWLWLLAILALPLLALVAFSAWALIIPAPEAPALAALTPSAGVAVEREPWLTFRPADAAPTTGLILYPGGRVDPRAYAPTARAIADEGYLVVIVPMPLNLAVLGLDRATEVIEAHPEIQRWAIGGHSLGGSMAAQYAHEYSGVIDGLVLWASYPPGSADLSNRNLFVSSIYGTLDGLTSPADIDASRERLPAETSFVPIEGGNHAQFGWYGPQGGDNPATISAEEQQRQIVAATLKLLAEIAGTNP